MYNIMRFITVFVILIFSLSNFAIGQTWQFIMVDNGVKPALDLDSQGNPHISYMLEAHPGYVRHAIYTRLH